MKNVYWLVLLGGLAFSVIFSAASSSDEKMTITLATTDWCPYTCIERGDGSNIIGQYITEILADHDIVLEIRSFPWSRAVKLAEQGLVDGLLTATRVEAPTLSFTQTPITNFSLCFYTLNNEKWRYHSPLALGNLSLGVIKGYGYNDEIDQYIQNNPANLVVLTGDEGVSRLLAMLKRQRVDVIVEDKRVLNWEINQNGLDVSNVNNAGCTTPQPFYLAMNQYNQQNAAVLTLLNQALAEKVNLQKLRVLFKKYAL